MSKKKSVLNSSLNFKSIFVGRPCTKPAVDCCIYLLRISADVWYVTHNILPTKTLRQIPCKKTLRNEKKALKVVILFYCYRYH